MRYRCERPCFFCCTTTYLLEASSSCCYTSLNTLRTLPSPPDTAATRGKEGQSEAIAVELMVT
eukprot:35265-Eustigmatos_ZCMA.PRE.1